jgi:hypothetical protein
MARAVDNENTRPSKEVRHLAGRASWGHRIADGIDEQNRGPWSNSLETREELAWGWEDSSPEADETKVRVLAADTS